MTEPKNNTQDVTPEEAAKQVLKAVVSTYHEILLGMRQRELAKSQPNIIPEVRPMKSCVFDLIKRTPLAKSEESSPKLTKSVFPTLKEIKTIKTGGNGGESKKGKKLGKGEIPSAPKPPQAPGAKPTMSKDDKVPAVKDQRANARLERHYKKHPENKQPKVDAGQEVKKDEKTPSPKFKHGDKVKIKGQGEPREDMTFAGYHPKEKGTVRVTHGGNPVGGQPEKTVHYNEGSIEHSAVDTKKDEMNPAKDQQKAMGVGTSTNKPAAIAKPVTQAKAVAAGGLRPASPGAASVPPSMAEVKYRASMAAAKATQVANKLNNKSPAFMSGIKR